MKVEVTQADIDAGIRKECMKCPVALAVKRLYPDREVKVGITRLYLKLHGIASCYRIPKEIAVKIARFDDGAKMVPMEFEAPWVESYA